MSEFVVWCGAAVMTMVVWSSRSSRSSLLYVVVKTFWVESRGRKREKK